MAATAYTPHPSIRPSHEYLKSLPTLRILTRENGGNAITKASKENKVNYQIDLKLETAQARYWLVTHCVGEGLSGWKEGVVFAEDLEPDENGEYTIIPYAPADLKKLQRFDYFWMLRTEFERLIDEPWSWERDKRVEEVRAEISKLFPIFRSVGATPACQA
jgi:hypothetical protein